jgi:hypothetical protein
MHFGNLHNDIVINTGEGEDLSQHMDGARSLARSLSLALSLLSLLSLSLSLQ